MRSGNPKVLIEETITDAAGRTRHLQTTKIPFAFSGTGRPAVLGVSIDVTARKAAEEALRRAAKEESLAVLAGGVAHDFNNLLAAILGHVSLALKQLPEASPVRRHVEKAAGAVERAADLTRQMLAYSGRGHFVVRPTDVNALARQNLPLLEVAVPKSVRLEARLAPGLPRVDADVGQIQQVLMNLVINAAEAIGERGGTVVLATGVREVTAADHALWRASGQPLPDHRKGTTELVGILKQTRPALGGNVMATIMTKDSPCQMATVRPGVFKVPVADPSRTGEIVRPPVELSEADLGLEAVPVESFASKISIRERSSSPAAMDSAREQTSMPISSRWPLG